MINWSRVNGLAPGGTLKEAIDTWRSLGEDLIKPSDNMRGMQKVWISGCSWWNVEILPIGSLQKEELELLITYSPVPSLGTHGNFANCNSTQSWIWHLTHFGTKILHMQTEVEWRRTRTEQKHITYNIQIRYILWTRQNRHHVHLKFAPWWLLEEFFSFCKNVFNTDVVVD